MTILSHHPHLCDPDRGWTFGAPSAPDTDVYVQAGATAIIYNAAHRFCGLYVDNETPDRDHYAAELVGIRAKGSWPIIVGLYPSEAGHRIRGCVCALEWYPFPVYEEVPLPKGQEAYIVQWNFRYDPELAPADPDYMQFDRRAPLPRHDKRLWLYRRAKAYADLVLRY